MVGLVLRICRQGPRADGVFRKRGEVILERWQQKCLYFRVPKLSLLRAINTPFIHRLTQNIAWCIAKCFRTFLACYSIFTAMSKNLFYKKTSWSQNVYIYKHTYTYIMCEISPLIIRGMVSYKSWTGSFALSR